MCNKLVQAFHAGWQVGYANPKWQWDLIAAGQERPNYSYEELRAFLNGMDDGRLRDTFRLLGVKLPITSETPHAL